jgi:hypothetical protein
MAFSVSIKKQNNCSADPLEQKNGCTVSIYLFITTPYQGQAYKKYRGTIIFVTPRIEAKVQFFVDCRNYFLEPDWFRRNLTSDNLKENVPCLNFSG